MRLRGGLAVAAAIALFAACAHDDIGARGPELGAPWGGSRVVAMSPGGVTLIIDGDARGARNAVRGDALIPVRVSVENHGRRTISVRYSDFALAGRAGQRYPALLPSEVVAQVIPALPPIVPAGTFMSELGDQPIVGVSGTPPIFNDPRTGAVETSFPYQWDYVKGFRGDRAAAAAHVQAQLLPEGPLAAGHSASGLLYFASAAVRDGAVALRADLTDADAATRIGRAVIPLRVVR